MEYSFISRNIVFAQFEAQKATVSLVSLRIGCDSPSVKSDRAPSNTCAFAESAAVSIACLRCTQRIVNIVVIMAIILQRCRGAGERYVVGQGGQL